MLEGTASLSRRCSALLYARRWVQPTLEVVGMQGGHTTEGTRSVVVSKAFAKIMCRLVPDQNASLVLEAMHRHVASHAPPHTNFTLTAVASHGRLLTEPYFIPKDAPGNRAAAKVIDTLWSRLVTKIWHLLTAFNASGLFQRLAPKLRVSFWQSLGCPSAIPSPVLACAKYWTQLVRGGCLRDAGAGGAA